MVLQASCQNSVGVELGIKHLLRLMISKISHYGQEGSLNNLAPPMAHERIGRKGQGALEERGPPIWGSGQLRSKLS